MKKKGHPQMPDFSRKRPAAPSGTVPDPKAQKTAAPPSTPNRNVKPQATSAKGNRRGS